MKLSVTSWSFPVLSLDEVGGLAVLAPVVDEAMLERAIRKAAA